MKHRYDMATLRIDGVAIDVKDVEIEFTGDIASLIVTTGGTPFEGGAESRITATKSNPVAAKRRRPPS